MRFRSIAIGGLLVLAACGSDEQVFAGQLEASVVYGEDDRLEVYAHPDDDLRRLAIDSVVALIGENRVVELPTGGYEVVAPRTVSERYNLCPGERFANQPAAATCAGVLIADDLVLTAGHCNTESLPCGYFKYVFNYHLEAENTPAPILDSDVYDCEEVVVDPGLDNVVPPDFAIIRLDRPATPAHVPAPVRSATPLEAGDSLAMIGSGSGLPTKIDSGAWVAEARLDLDYYRVNFDAFEGHSGSPAFDADNRLAGILTGGRVPDYVFDPGGESCNRVNTFEDGEAGEFVHNVAPIIYALCEEGEGGDALCGDESCDGELCGAPPAAKVPSEPGGSPVVSVPASNGGCSATNASGAPSASLWIVMLWLVASRLRRRAA